MKINCVNYMSLNNTVLVRKTNIKEIEKPDAQSEIKISSSTFGSNYIPQNVLAFEQRKANILDTLQAMGSSEKFPLIPKKLIEECEKEYYNHKKFLLNKNVSNFSILTHENIGILEKCVNNDVLRNNDNLNNGIMFSIINSFVRKKDNMSGIEFRSDSKMRSIKINLVLDAYLSNPECQKSELMTENIAYILERCLDATYENIGRLIEIMNDPELFNDKEVVDDILFSLKKPPIEKTKNRKMNIRLEKAARKMDTVKQYRNDLSQHQGIKRYSVINEFNLPIIEKMFSDNSICGNDLWGEHISYFLTDFNRLYRGSNDITELKSKQKKAIKIMDTYLKDKTAYKDIKKTEMYIEQLDEICAS